MNHKDAEADWIFQPVRRIRRAHRRRGWLPRLRDQVALRVEETKVTEGIETLLRHAKARLPPTLLELPPTLFELWRTRWRTRRRTRHEPQLVGGTSTNGGEARQDPLIYACPSRLNQRRLAKIFGYDSASKSVPIRAIRGEELLWTGDPPTLRGSCGAASRERESGTPTSPLRASLESASSGRATGYCRLSQASRFSIGAFSREWQLMHAASS